MKISNPGKAFQTLKRMGTQAGDCDDDGSFTLLNHADLNLTTEESVEHIANYFAKISQEYPPLDRDLLPERVKVKIKT